MHSLLHTDNAADKDIPTLLSDKTKELAEVEEYFLKKTSKYTDMEVSYDCTAEEPIYWKTLNYTTYAGCFIMHPLRGQAAFQQMVDAYVDGTYNPDWIDHFNQKLKKGTASKYIKRTDKTEKDCLNENELVDCLVVLPGHNKLAKHTCAGKLRNLHDLAKKVTYKKHPISDQNVYDGLFEHLKRDGVKDIHSIDSEYELYDLMSISRVVATGFASESALYAVADGLPLECIDLYQNKETAPFYHINWFLFYEDDPAYFVNKAFNSYKSGIINLDVDKEWKLKVDRYVDYIRQKRNKFGAMYVG